MGGVVRRYLYRFTRLLIPIRSPLVLALFCSNIPIYLLIFNVFCLYNYISAY